MRAILDLYQDLADRVEELEKVTDYHGQKFGVVSGFPQPDNVRSEISETEDRVC
jgi:hypothetical protein